MFHKIAGYNFNEIQFITLLFIYNALFVKFTILYIDINPLDFPLHFFKTLIAYVIHCIQ